MSVPPIQPSGSEPIQDIVSPKGAMSAEEMANAMLAGTMPMHLAYVVMMLMSEKMEVEDENSKLLLKVQALQGEFANDLSELSALLAELRSQDPALFDVNNYDYTATDPKSYPRGRRILEKIRNLLKKMYVGGVDAEGNPVNSDLKNWEEGQKIAYRLRTGKEWDPSSDSAYGILTADRDALLKEDPLLKEGGAPGMGIGNLLLKGDYKNAAIRVKKLLNLDVDGKGNMESLISNCNRQSSAVQGVDQQNSHELERRTKMVQTLNETAQKQLKEHASFVETIVRNYAK